MLSVKIARSTTKKVFMIIAMSFLCLAINLRELVTEGRIHE